MQSRLLKKPQFVVYQNVSTKSLITSKTVWSPSFSKKQYINFLGHTYEKEEKSPFLRCSRQAKQTYTNLLKIIPSENYQWADCTSLFEKTVYRKYINVTFKTSNGSEIPSNDEVIKEEHESLVVLSDVLHFSIKLRRVQEK